MSKIVVGDADSLIALVHQADSNHQRAQKISDQLFSGGYEVIYPNTTIVEAVTTLKRALNLPDKAQLINKQYQQGAFHVEYINEEIMARASRIFDKAVSKKNTFFDAIVAATAENLEAEAIFSFDDWYPKLGLKLVET